VVEGHEPQIQRWRGLRGRLAAAVAGGGDGALADRLGVRAGMPSPWRGEGLAQRWPGRAQFGRGGVDAAQLFGQRVGPLSFGAVGEEAAGLPAHPPLQRRQAALTALIYLQPG
jgi:hypothetical protein